MICPSSLPPPHPAPLWAIVAFWVLVPWFAVTALGVIWFMVREWFKENW